MATFPPQTPTTTSINIKLNSPDNRPDAFKGVIVWEFCDDIPPTLRPGQLVRINGFGRMKWRVDYKDVQIVGWTTWSLARNNVFIDIATPYHSPGAPNPPAPSRANIPVATWDRLTANKKSPLALLRSLFKRS